MFKRKVQAVVQRRMEGWENSAALELSWRGGPPDDGEQGFKEQEEMGFLQIKKKKRTRVLANIWGIKNTEEKEQGQLYLSDPGLRADGANRPHESLTGAVLREGIL